MWKTARSKAEERFSATQKKTNQALKEAEKERQKQSAHTAKLKSLRLAKEAADKEAADKQAAETAAKEKVATKKK